VAAIHSERVRLSSKLWLYCVIIALGAGVLTHSAVANPDPPLRWREVWAGADISQDVWLVYSGVTVAPMSHIHGDGVRMRVTGGYGEYRYSDDRAGDIQTFQAKAHFADVLVGYQKRIGELTAKAFVGIATIGHDIAPFDDQTLAIGDEIGAKGVVELWLNMGDRAWGSLDLSWASAHNTRAARFRMGFRIIHALSLGIEGAVNVDAQGECRMQSTNHAGCRAQYDEADGTATLLDYGRGGLFVRYEWQGGEVSLSGGALGGGLRGDDDASIDPYMTLNWITQF
jgi:Cellulose biosynthesis protein BcsS